MALVVAGKLNKQIGPLVELTEAPVKLHRGQIMRKLDADSLADLVKLAGRLRSGDDDAGV